MKFLSAQVSLFLQHRGARRNIAFLLRFLFLLLALIFIYTIIFHYIMEYEEQTFSWLTGVYWTLTVMTTLGFGDITFTSDLGRGFSIIVLLSGVFLLLVMLPFTFIQYFYAPWLEAQKKNNAPRSLPEETRGHVILCGINPATLNLVDELREYGAHCVLLCPEAQGALDLMDQDYDVMVGDHDDAETYKNLQLSNAAMLVALDSDIRNTSIIFTARDIAPNVPITASVQSEDAIDILELAGGTHVFQFPKLLGEALARRVISPQAPTSVVSQFGELVVAEALAMRTPLVGQSLRDCGLRAATGAMLVGVWKRGVFTLPTPDMIFAENMVLVFAGTAAQLQNVDRMLARAESEQTIGPVVILGGGRVGRAAAGQLASSGRAYRIVDKNQRLIAGDTHGIAGDAADLEILEKAGIRTAPSVLITTHDDDTNIYLTLYCRRLRPDIQIISRATLERNVQTLHAAGADLVLSLTSMLTNTVVNLLAPGKLLLLNEGLNIFRTEVPSRLIGHPLLGSGIRSGTQCSVVAVRDSKGALHINPDPAHIFAAGEELYLIGGSQGQRRYFETFNPQAHLDADAVEAQPRSSV